MTDTCGWHEMGAPEKGPCGWPCEQEFWIRLKGEQRTQHRCRKHRLSHDFILKLQKAESR